MDSAAKLLDSVELRESSWGISSSLSSSSSSSSSGLKKERQLQQIWGTSLCCKVQRIKRKEGATCFATQAEFVSNISLSPLIKLVSADHSCKQEEEK